MIKNASKDIYKDYKTEIIEHKRPILNYIFTVFILFLIQNKEKKYLQTTIFDSAFKYCNYFFVNI